MKMISRIAAAALLGAMTLTGVSATPALARGGGGGHFSAGAGIGHGGGFGHGFAPGFRNPGFGHGYYAPGFRPGWGVGYRYGALYPTCWTDWQWDPYWNQDVPVRVCY